MWAVPWTLKLGQVLDYFSHGLQIKRLADRDTIPAGTSGEHLVDFLGSKHLFVYQAAAALAEAIFALRLTAVSFPTLLGRRSPVCDTDSE